MFILCRRVSSLIFPGDCNGLWVICIQWNVSTVKFFFFCRTKNGTIWNYNVFPVIADYRNKVNGTQNVLWQAAFSRKLMRFFFHRHFGWWIKSFMQNWILFPIKKQTIFSFKKISTQPQMRCSVKTSFRQLSHSL